MRMMVSVVAMLAAAGCGKDYGPCGPGADPETRPEQPEAEVISETLPLTVQAQQFIARNLRDWRPDDFWTTPDDSGIECKGWVQADGGYRLFAIRDGQEVLVTERLRPDGFPNWHAHVPEGGLVVDADNGYLIVNTDNTQGNRVVHLVDDVVTVTDFAPLASSYVKGNTFLMPTNGPVYAGTGVVYKDPEGGGWKFGVALFETGSTLVVRRGTQDIDLPDDATPTSTTVLDRDSGAPKITITSGSTSESYLYDPMNNVFIELP